MTNSYEEKTDKSGKDRDQFFVSSGINRFGERLKTMMELRGIKSNIKMGALCDMSDTVIRNYLIGKTYPTIDRLATIAFVLDCSPEWLLTGGNENKDVQLKNKTTINNSNIKSDSSELSIILNRLPKEQRDALLDTILLHGVSGILNALAELESVTAFSLLSTEERKRLLDLHDAFEEAKKGAPEVSTENHVANPTQKQVG